MQDNTKKTQDDTQKMQDDIHTMSDDAKKMLMDGMNEIEHNWSKTILGLGPCSQDYIVWRATLAILSVMEKYRDQLTDVDWGWWVFQETARLVSIYNELPDCGYPIKYTTLLPIQLAHLVNFLYTVRRIPCAGERGKEDLDLLAVYQREGKNAGLYVESERALRKIVRNLKSTIDSKEFAEVRQALMDIVLRVELTQDRDLIPVENGIFDYRKKTLIPYCPEYIFMTKSRVKYNQQAQNVVIHNPEDGTDWDVESWMAELSDDPAVVELLWQILGAVIRPFVRWRKAAMFIGEGNNGKGTLCELMRNLCGDGRHANIPIWAFSQEFLLEKLPEVMSIIVDENDVGTYLERAGNFKAVVTNDFIQINRKNKTAISFQFHGFMVQGFNAMPRFKDKTDSIYRRLIFISFDKCFTDGERTYIKDDYLKRPEVLEYVMYRVLNMDYYELSEPAVCRALLDDYKIFNDPIRQWWEEHRDKFVWDLLPWKFLYAHYRKFMQERNPSGKISSDRGFISEMRKIVEKDDTWMCPTTVDKNGLTKDKQVSASDRIVCDEPLGADVWYDYGNKNRWQGTHRGLVRRVPRQQAQSHAPLAQHPGGSNPYTNSSEMVDRGVLAQSK